MAIVLIALAPVAEQIGLHHAEARNRVRPMCDRADGDTLDPFAMREDKAYVFSADGTAGLAYRYINGIGLASADPFGNPDAYAEVIAAFIDRCDANGWRPASLGVRHDRLALWQAAGLRAHYLGDEAIVDVESFTLEGRAMRPVRQAANRTKNHGITTEIMREGELNPDLRAALQGMAERHRNGEPERGFSMALDGLLVGPRPAVPRDRRPRRGRHRDRVPALRPVQAGQRTLDRRDASRPGRAERGQRADDRGRHRVGEGRTASARSRSTSRSSRD